MKLAQLAVGVLSCLLLFAILVIQTTPRSYEYRTLLLTNYDHWATQLSVLGQDGWEAYAVDVSGGLHAFHLKRSKW